MARKKAEPKEESLEPEGDYIDQLFTKVTEDYGKGVLVDGDDVVNKEQVIIPWSPCLDQITGGGIQEGSWVGISGEPKTGKTTAALTFAAEAQQPEWAMLQPDGSMKCRPIFYSKIEGRLSTEHLKDIKRLNIDKGSFFIIQSCKGKILNAQQHLDILERVIKGIPGAVIIIDSISTLCDEREATGGLGTETRGGGAKLFSQFLRSNGQIVPINDTIVIGITHIINNTSGFGASRIEKGANAWKYQKDYDVRPVKKEKWVAGKSVLGLRIEWICNTTPIGNPYQTIEGYLRWGVGIDRLFEAIQLGVTANLIVQSGCWFYMKYLEGKGMAKEEAPNLQGAEAVYHLLEEHPEWVRALENDLKGMTGLTISGGG